MPCNQTQCCSPVLGLGFSWFPEGQRESEFSKTDAVAGLEKDDKKTTSGLRDSHRDVHCSILLLSRLVLAKNVTET